MNSNNPHKLARRTAGIPAVDRRTSVLAGTLALLIVAGSLPSEADAAAWTRKQGSALLSLPATYTKVDEQFNADGDRVDRLEFEEVEIAPYFEIGLTDSLTFGLQPKHRSVEVEQPDGTRIDNSGLAEADVLLRQGLWTNGNAAFSIQGLVKAPIDPQEDSPAALGRDQVDAELMLLFGNRHPGESVTFFYNVGIGYRMRFEGLDDQVKANAFVGWGGQKWTFLLTSDNTIGLETTDEGSEVLTTERSFTQYEAGLVTSYRVTDAFILSINGSTTYAGEGVGAGNSGGLSALVLW